jgi:phosphoglycerate dehydrogenase-like enzyme
VIGVLYPRDGEFRPVEDRVRDIEALHAVDDRVRVLEASYPVSPHSPPRTKEDLGQVNAAPTGSVLDVLSQAEVVLAHDLPGNVCELAPRLRWIHGIGAGVSQFCTDDVVRRGVRVTSSAGANAASVAEFAVTRLLMAWKGAGRLHDLQTAHQWGAAPTRELAGARVGIVGYGAIGRQIALRLAGFEVDVSVLRRSASSACDAPVVSRVYGIDQLHEFLGQCDAVLAAVPESGETQALFDAAAFAAMKPGSFFCNVGRGSLVVESALVDALRRGHLGSAALDVTSVEPLPPDSDLWDTPNLMLSPHAAASLERFFVRVHAQFRDNVSRFLAGEPLVNEIDPAGMLWTARPSDAVIG